ncbi:MAG: thioesterase family protein [Alphaproteobacteria bacterium]
MSETENDPIWGRGTVYPDDCDHMGHMNVAAYVRKFDEATWALWSGVGMTAKRMLGDGVGLAALESKFTYHKELFPGDSFVVRSRILARSAKTARFHHRLYRLEEADGGLIETLASTCTYTVACLDRDAHRARPWPEDVAARADAVLTPLAEDAA